MSPLAASNHNVAGNIQSGRTRCRERNDGDQAREDDAVWHGFHSEKENTTSPTVFLGNKLTRYLEGTDCHTSQDK